MPTTQLDTILTDQPTIITLLFREPPAPLPVFADPSAPPSMLDPAALLAEYRAWGAGDISEMRLWQRVPNLQELGLVHALARVTRERDALRRTALQRADTIANLQSQLQAANERLTELGVDVDPDLGGT
jgi:hypothetical protein